MSLRKEITDVVRWRWGTTGAVVVLCAGGWTAAAAPVVPSPAETRAGTVAGEGRERPGREPEEADTEVDEGEEEAVPESRAPSPAAEPVGQAVVVRTSTRTTDRRALRVLTLGTGLLLVGLGLGVGLAGMRLRRN